MCLGDRRMKTDCFGGLEGRFTGSRVESQTQKNARKSVCGTDSYAGFARWSMQLNHGQAATGPELPHPPFDPRALRPLPSHGDGRSRQPLIFPCLPARAKAPATAGAFLPPSSSLRTVEPLHSRSPFPERFSHSN